MKLSILRKELIENKDGIADEYISWLVENCTDDCDLDTDFHEEDFGNLISFWNDKFKENYGPIIDDKEDE